jgi:hypothetical protein
MIVPWNEISHRYREVVESGEINARGMLRLVEQIEASPYSQALYGWTSMLDLCIVQVPCTYPYNGPYLRISPRGDGTMEFRYVDTNIESRQWHRIVKDGEAFQRLERFIDQLHGAGEDA